MLSVNQKYQNYIIISVYILGVVFAMYEVTADNDFQGLIIISIMSVFFLPLWYIGAKVTFLFRNNEPQNQKLETIFSKRFLTFIRIFYGGIAVLAILLIIYLKIVYE